MTAQEIKHTTNNQGGAAITGINTDGGWGIYAESKGAAIGGKNTGNWIGVYGESPNHFGVMGKSTASAGVVGESVKWIGVYGESQQGFGVNGKSTSSAGVVGTSKTWKGVYGESEQNEGVHGYSKSRSSAGVVGIGAGMGIYCKSEDPNGAALVADGRTSTKTLEILGGSDIAEHFTVSKSESKIEAGTLMVIDEKNAGSVVPSALAYDKRVVGVVSGAGGVKTGMTLRQEGVLEGEAVVAVAGRVYVKVSSINGKIKPGDLLTSSNIPGYAMKATKKRKATGAIIGKAMTSLDAKEGLVLILVNLQ
jgi:hypothetical protein